MYFIANSEAASRPLRRDRVKINNASNSLDFFFLHNAYKKLFLLLSTIQCKCPRYQMLNIFSHDTKIYPYLINLVYDKLSVIFFYQEMNK